MVVKAWLAQSYIVQPTICFRSLVLSGALLIGEA